MGVGRTILDHVAWYRDTREAVAKRAGFRCQKCNRFVGMHGQADHIIPRAKCEAHGLSEYDQSNLQWLCQPCHASKSAKEKWDAIGRRKGPKPIKRSNVPGRKLFLAMAGIPPDGKGQPP
ncbi:HNH endonuclease [Shimia sp. CNT1-13L.2]|uniref:HNH endonuclease n=1 Tax=Shimia sp. CNT1-13L.2 TaxID=2959663 RepID=UPI0020CEA5FC|nr:HNH endonuclease signature motif containing protein [Shimia sp. CNT1-13L.2]